ncbi:transposase [Salinimicrobium xinjiangense]|uniref:transposase n=1 Tax=Salinimicrobium xinjiangense TaxID=438596 RepID=UPI00048B079E|nr:transposase [Salinimicrobium xinjiangense]
MSQKFRNKYRISTTRIQTWDYGSNASYFITICTGGRIPFFGKISPGNPQMDLSALGHVAFDLYKNIPSYFSYVVLDEFVIMPDHIHGIITIKKPITDGNCRAAINRTSTNDDIPMKNGGVTGNKNPMFHQNLSRIIRWFKGRTTFECRKINSDFHWQSGFHEHIIRNSESHQRIKNYIRNNPLNWK